MSEDSPGNARGTQVSEFGLNGQAEAGEAGLDRLT